MTAVGSVGEDWELVEAPRSQTPPIGTVDPSERTHCFGCDTRMILKKKCCAKCGEVFCGKCARFQRRIDAATRRFDPMASWQTVCTTCFALEAPQTLGLSRRHSQGFEKLRTRLRARSLSDIQTHTRKLAAAYGSCTVKDKLLQGVGATPRWAKVNLRSNVPCRCCVCMEPTQCFCCLCGIYYCSNCLNAAVQVFKEDAVVKVDEVSDDVPPHKSCYILSACRPCVHALRRSFAVSRNEEPPEFASSHRRRSRASSMLDSTQLSASRFSERGRAHQRSSTISETSGADPQAPASPGSVFSTASSSDGVDASDQNTPLSWRVLRRLAQLNASEVVPVCKLVDQRLTEYETLVQTLQTTQEFGQSRTRRLARLHFDLVDAFEVIRGLLKQLIKTASATDDRVVRGIADGMEKRCRLVYDRKPAFFRQRTQVEEHFQQDVLEAISVAWNEKAMAVVCSIVLQLAMETCAFDWLLEASLYLKETLYMVLESHYRTILQRSLKQESAVNERLEELRRIVQKAFKNEPLLIGKSLDKNQLRQRVVGLCRQAADRLKDNGTVYALKPANEALDVAVIELQELLADKALTKSVEVDEDGWVLA